jgi:polysaccharide chain length determinant protein (PEP-CTERM system associated)
MIPGKHYTPEELWRIARRRRWLVLMPFVLVTAGTALVAQFLPDRYRSETVILAVPQQVPKDYVQSTVTSGLQDRLLAINQQILSRTRLEQLVVEFNLYAEKRKTAIMEEVIEQMRTYDIDVKLGAGRQGSAPTVRVSYTGTDARTAMLVTERLASFFIEENLRDRAAAAEGTNQFLEVQLQEARNRLIDQEKRLEAYRQKNAGQLPSQLDANMQAAQSIQMQLQALAHSISQDGDRRLMLERLLSEAETAPSLLPGTGATVPDGGTDAVLVELPVARQLELARAQLRALELRLKPAHPDLTRAKRAVAELERKADAEALRQALSPTGDGASLAGVSPQEYQRQIRLREMQAEREALVRRITAKETEEKRLRQALAGYQAKIAGIPERETELVELTRDYETYQRIYTNLLAKSESARTAADLERRQIGEQFKVLDPARLSERPISPNRTHINSIGALVGLGLGLGLVLLLEYLDRTLRTESDVLDALALPVLALVPRMLSVVDRQRQRRRRRRLRLAAATVVLALVGGSVGAWRLGLVERLVFGVREQISVVYGTLSQLRTNF